MRPPSVPFDTLGVGLLGPFLNSPRGNRYVLVNVDYLTKWVEVPPVREATADTLAVFVETNIVVRHGSPRLVISDRGIPFKSRHFASCLAALGIRHTPSSS